MAGCQSCESEGKFVDANKGAKLKSLDDQLRSLQKELRGVKRYVTALQSFASRSAKGGGDSNKARCAAEHLRGYTSSLVEQTLKFSDKMDQFLSTCQGRGRRRQGKATT
jgi:hypothetical protein